VKRRGSVSDRVSLGCGSIATALAIGWVMTREGRTSRAVDSVFRQRCTVANSDGVESDGVESNCLEEEGPWRSAGATRGCDTGPR
jgi:hypothetical protein